MVVSQRADADPEPLGWFDLRSKHLFAAAFRCFMALVCIRRSELDGYLAWPSVWKKLKALNFGITRMIGILREEMNKYRQWMTWICLRWWIYARTFIWHLLAVEFWAIETRRLAGLGSEGTMDCFDFVIFRANLFQVKTNSFDSAALAGNLGISILRTFMTPDMTENNLDFSAPVFETRRGGMLTISQLVRAGFILLGLLFLSLGLNFYFALCGKRIWSSSWTNQAGGH